jgi:hypothetical protein
MGTALVGALLVLLSARAGAEVVLYEHSRFKGTTITLDSERPVPDLAREGFGRRASSVWVKSGRWQLCSDGNYRGQCIVLDPGRYENLKDQGLNDAITSVRHVREGGSDRSPTGGNWRDDGGQSQAIVLFEDANFAGTTYTVEGQRNVDNLSSAGFNDRASSVVVKGGLWQLCSDARYQGQCVTVGPGRYPSLQEQGLNDAISSVRYLGGG